MSVNEEESWGLFVSEENRDKIKEFFMIHDPERLATSNFNILLKYIAKKGIDSLNEKLQEKYGARIKFSPQRSQVDLPRVKQRNRGNITSIRLRAGINPENGEGENEIRAEIFDKLTVFYRKYNPQRLHQGIGDVVDFAVKGGLDKLNKKLRNTYNHDLDSEISETMDGNSVSVVEQPQVSSPDRPLRQDLVNYFHKVDPTRGVGDMQVLVDYAKKEGMSALNERLSAKYGKNLIKSELPKYIRLMLERFYARYDQRMLDEYNLNRVLDWTVRNGVDKLNLKLKDKYGISLQNFIEYANELRDDLIDFYRRADKNKLVVGIQPIFEWGLRNGRTALNQKLRQKYSTDLEENAMNIAEQLTDSASQFN